MSCTTKIAILDVGTTEGPSLLRTMRGLGFDADSYPGVAPLTKEAERVAVIVLPSGERAAWAAENLRRNPATDEIPLLGVGRGMADSVDVDAWIPWPLADDRDTDQMVTLLERFRELRHERLHLHKARERMRLVASAGQLLAEADSLEPVIGEFLGLVGEALGSTLVVAAIMGKAGGEAWVVASSDAGYLHGQLPLDEVGVRALVQRTSENLPVVVALDERDALGVQALLADGESRFPFSATFPVYHHGQPVGALIADLEQEDDTEALLGGRMLAVQLGLALGVSRLRARLSETTKRVNLADLATEQRTRQLKRYTEFFDTSSDGVIILDASAHVLHINRAGQMITGYSQEWLLNRPLIEIITPEHQEGLDEIISRAVAGEALRNFDMKLITTSGDAIQLAVSTSSLLLDEMAVVFAFRDVTEARAIESELVKTKEFLEKLIHSTVDAIVATDVDGLVILYNPGAEWIFGRSADETVGQLTLSEFFTHDGYDTLMEQLHSPDHGGEGRLEQSRHEIVDAAGRIIPVNLTASIISEAERDVGLVAVLSDLREQIQIEERLAITQEKLEVSEKQVLLAELAGTTAHELNQPLTSVMGYAELLLKRVEPDHPLRSALETIMREAERMAAIVRKIGKITRYETKSYVGRTQILDLERAADD